MIQLDLDSLGIDDFALMDGERMDSVLGDGQRDTGDDGAVLLTDRRVIRVSGNRKQRQTSFASIHDVAGVELSFEQEGHGSLVWAAIGFAVAILLYFAIDHALGRLAAPAAVAAMAVYLIIDRMTTSGRRTLFFKTGSSEVQCKLPDGLESAEIQSFINRMYELRESSRRGVPYRASNFAPR